jgi:hypothetical protein
MWSYLGKCKADSASDVPAETEAEVPAVFPAETASGSEADFTADSEAEPAGVFPSLFIYFVKNQPPEVKLQGAKSQNEFNFITRPEIGSDRAMTQAIAVP